MADNDPKPTAPPEVKEDDDMYYDPFEEFGFFTEEELRNVMSDTNPDLTDISFTQNPLPLPTQAMEISETPLSQELSLSVSDYDTSDDFLGLSFEDDLTLSCDMFEIPMDDLNINYNLLGDNIDNGNNVGENTRLEVSTRIFQGNNGPNFEIGGTSTIPVSVTPPISQGNLLCTCCNLLRQLLHTTGQELIRFDIHGGNGVFCHAVIETQRYDPKENLHQTLNFKGLRMEDVNKFIEDYCLWRKSCGFTLMYDSNSAFYRPMDAFNINNQPLPLRVNVPMSLAMPNEALGVPHVPLYVGLREEPKPKKIKERRQTPLAAQRERTGKMTLKDISMHFRVPMAEAARKLSLCPTVVKKICRRGGVFRWPHRKIRSIERKISALKSVLHTAKDARVRARLECEIERLQNILNEIYGLAYKNAQ